MSVVGEARQRVGPSPWPGRVLHAIFGLLLVLLGLLVVGAGGLAWRLSQGPLEIGWLARRAEASVFPDGSPTRLSIGSASVAWNGFQDGAEGGLELRLHQLRLTDADDAAIARLETADVTLSLQRLLAFEIVPRRVVLAGLRLRAVRDADGQVTFDFGGLDDLPPADHPAASLDRILAELRRPAGNDRGGGGGLRMLAQLQHATVSDAQLQLEDQASGKTLRADLAGLDLVRQGVGGVKGSATGKLALGDAVASLRLDADLLPNGGTHVAAALAPTQAGPLAQSSPAVAELGTVEAAVQARATLDLSPDLTPTAAELHIAAGGGTVSASGGTVTFEKVLLDATGTWADATLRPAAVSVQRAQIVLPSSHGGWSTTLGATGQVARSDGKLTAAVDLSVDHLDFADLGALWPAAWGGNVRPWLVENVTSGTGRDGAFQLKLAAPEDRPAELDLVDAGGTLQGEDLTIHWLRPIPPIEHAQAQVRVLGPDVIDVTVPAGGQAALSLKDGLVHFTGLSKKDQTMELTANLQGPVTDTLQLLRQPRLKLLDRHPLPIKSAGGAVAARLQVDMPLKKDLTADQVDVAAQGRLTQLRLAGVVAGRDLDHGDIQFDVSQDGLKASGPATVAGVVGVVDVAMDFRAGPPNQVLQQASMTGHATAAQMTAAGIDPGGLITAGHAGLTASYMAQRDGTGRIEVGADLAPAGLSLFSWRKPPGPAASASARIMLKNDKLALVDHIDAHGPGLDVVGRAEMIGGRPLLLRFDRVVLGATQAAGDIAFPARSGEPIRIRFTGPMLDAGSELDTKPGRPAEGNAIWVADLHFDRVRLGTGRELTDVTAHAEDDGHRLSVLNANSTGPVRVHAVIVPQGNGRRLSIRAADAGALFQAFDVFDSLQGGTLAVEAHFDDSVPSSPLGGTLDLSEFGVKDAVVIGKMLQAITVYGIVDALRGPGVQFTRLTLPFRYDRRQLVIGEARAYSASLGITASGWLDFARGVMDVRGTIVPAYAVNSALGRIPVVGYLFSPERGGGLVAVNYGVTGKTKDPNIAVNPLSALTPGFLRRLFSVFG